MYELISIVRNRNKPNIYIIKDKYGNISHVKAREVREILLNGNSVAGLKMAKDGRIITDKKFNMSKQYKNKNGVAEINREYALYSGDYLKDLVKYTSRFKQRDVVVNILNYVNKIDTHKIFILHGIRRVGKTVSIKQAINDLINKGVDTDDIIYIEVTSSVGIENIHDRLSKIRNKIIFIDEITKASNFIEKANFLSDILVSINNNRVIITGTESLAFPISIKTSLYDRAEFNRCTLISFKEYQSLFGYTYESRDRAINDYAVNGGAMLRSEFSSISNVENTLSSVVIANIRSTINRNKYLLENDRDIGVVNNLPDTVIAYLIYSLVISSVSPKKYSSFANSLIKIGKEKASILADTSGISAEMFLCGDSILKGVKGKDIAALMNILGQLDIVAKLPNLAVEDEENSIYKVTDIELCTLIQALAFRVNYQTKNKSKLIGDMIENMVIGQVMIYGRKNTNIQGLNIGYLKYTCGRNQYEIDCIFKRDIDLFESKAYAIEIKSGSRILANWDKNLKHDKLAYVAGVKPENLAKIIVYNGDTQTIGDIQYINCYDFMMNIDKWLSN